MSNCPKCGSANIHVDKKGFSVKKSLAGGFLFGTIGLLGGAVGSNKIKLTCLDCGYTFNPGDSAPTETDRIMAHYAPINAENSFEQPQRKSKTTNQKVKIETLLKYRNVISDSKAALLEAMMQEGSTYVIVPTGEIDTLSKLQRENSPIKRIVSFKECNE